MTEQIASAWDAIAHFLTSKITSLFVAGSLVVSAETAKVPPYVNIIDDGFLWFTYADWMKVIGCLWISILIAEKLGMFRLIKWLWQRGIGCVRNNP